MTTSKEQSVVNIPIAVQCTRCGHMWEEVPYPNANQHRIREGYGWDGEREVYLKLDCENCDFGDGRLPTAAAK